jgi:hypothetical protein
MRKVIMAAVALGLLVQPAAAQMGGKRQGGSEKVEKKGPVIDEKAYKAALQRIPEPKEKYDPWGQMRPTPAAKP